jgi:hypothetical protein
VAHDFLPSIFRDFSTPQTLHTFILLYFIITFFGGGGGGGTGV